MIIAVPKDKGIVLSARREGVNSNNTGQQRLCHKIEITSELKLQN